MENKLVAAVIILDLSAIFNTVDHDLLMRVPHSNFGINGHNLKPRKFKVNINGIYSVEKTMQFSVLQGSVQGAFLFKTSP